MKIPEAIEGDYGKEVKVYLRKGQLADEWSTSQHELKSSSKQIEQNSITLGNQLIKEVKVCQNPGIGTNTSSLSWR